MEKTAIIITLIIMGMLVGKNYTMISTVRAADREDRERIGIKRTPKYGSLILLSFAGLLALSYLLWN